MNSNRKIIKIRSAVMTTKHSNALMSQREQGFDDYPSQCFKEKSVNTKIQPEGLFWRPSGEHFLVYENDRVNYLISK